MPPRDFIVGVDLAQLADYTAITVLERRAVVVGPDAEPAGHYDLSHLERFNRVPYDRVVARVGAVVADIHRAGGAFDDDGWPGQPWRAPTIDVVIDGTGVGVAVADMFRAARLAVVPIVITAGDQAHAVDGTWRVPKRDLVLAVQLALQQHRLRVAAALPETETLVRELSTFTARISLAGRLTFGAAGATEDDWRGGAHDDTVLATAIALWWGEHRAGQALRPVSGALRQRLVRDLANVLG